MPLPTPSSAAAGSIGPRLKVHSEHRIVSGRRPMRHIPTGVPSNRCGSRFSRTTRRTSPAIPRSHWVPTTGSSRARTSATTYSIVSMTSSTRCTASTPPRSIRSRRGASVGFSLVDDLAGDRSEAIGAFKAFQLGFPRHTAATDLQLAGDQPGRPARRAATSGRPRRSTLRRPRRRRLREADPAGSTAARCARRTPRRWCLLLPCAGRLPDGFELYRHVPSR